ncbi:type I polyketide synthase [Undibacterium sp. TS12]|uniref:type I polyketide synthase n=1 Tax=Undibacterium sp. TS12 TaxID=2908202 RepID=UPI001F4C572B|nr:type I polyketide synthase [Undibacterium sp. TS12]MCH8620246.1 KR domain-containing protein [Undibacterium sp. TS12]
MIRSPENRIAIIGMAGRFPGAENIDQLWHLLKDGKEGISHFSEHDLLAAGVPQSLLQDENYVRASGSLKNVDQFDAGFFGFTNKQAADLDPQQRLFLECAWEALEDAGCDPESEAGAIGVFAGAGANRYGLQNLLDEIRQHRVIEVMQRTLASDKDFLSTRTSYKLNLRGPSATYQTACSTALYAVHAACQSLMNGESDIAIAGGVNVHLPQGTGYLYTNGGILSRDGHCRAFDAHASGTVPASGAGIVVLRRLDHALAHGNRIDATILNSAVNNDGSSKVGYTAPSVDGQRRVIEAALNGIDPGSIAMLEAHGTGTVLGDAVELTALSEAYGVRAPGQAACSIGSIKSNLGHLDAAAGIAGLIKTVLCLKHRQFVPTLHVENVHELLAENSGAFVPDTRLRHWPLGLSARRAGVSSFGMGGTNVHMILEEAPVTKAQPEKISDEHLFVLSAKTPTALGLVRERLAKHLREQPDAALNDVAHTLTAGRSRFAYRQAIISSNRDKLLETLERDIAPWAGKGSDISVVFSLEHAGHEDVAVLESLYYRDRDWQDRFNDCTALIRRLTEINIDIHVLTGASNLANDPVLTMWLSFISQYCSVSILKMKGVLPGVLAGVGIGELVAANVAGVFSLEDCIRMLDAGLREDVSALTKVLASSIASQADIPLVSLTTGLEPAQADLSDASYWSKRLQYTRPHCRTNDLQEDEGIIIVPCGSKDLADFCSNMQDSLSVDGDHNLLLAVTGLLWLHGARLAYGKSPAKGGVLISLPTYPFERETCWLTDVAPSMSHASTPQIYFPVWQHSPISSSVSTTGTWLILGLNETIGDTLADQLLQNGCTVIRASWGRENAQLATDRFSIAPDETCGFDSLMRTLASRDIEFITLSPPSFIGSTRTTEKTPSAEMDAAYLAIVRLVSALMRDKSQTSLHMAVVGKNFSPDLQSMSNIDHAAIHVLPRLLVQEWPGLSSKVIDLPPLDIDTDNADEAQKYAKWISAELAGTTSDLSIAYRSNLRLVRRFIASTDEEEVASAIRHSGVYLITGGLGDIGTELALFLARHYQARLILLSRHGLPSRHEWDAALTDNRLTDSVRRRIETIREIETLGGKACVVAADTADTKTLAAALVKGEQELGAISGVFHLAADLDDASVQTPLATLKHEHLERQYHPKVLGALALEQVLKGRLLDFAVLFSSTSAILGGTGFGAYAAANATLDALAYAQRLCGDKPWLTINWDGWNTHGLGVAASTAIGVEEGMKILLRALSCVGIPQLIVSKSDFPALAAKALLRATTQASTANSVKTTDSASIAPQVSELERLIIDIWEKNLGIAGIGLHDDFFAVGGDSLALLGVTSGITQVLHVDVPMRDYSRHGMTVAGFASAIVAYFEQLKARQTENTV